jgi:RNA polymerase sigma-70 factor (ECF subfamily)
MTERTNEQWLSELRSTGQTRSGAIDNLRLRLERGLFYYLNNDRSDLADRSSEELQQMAQDFVQDALLKILDSLDSFRGESRFTTWAAKIASRVAISELRRVRYKDYSLNELTAGGDLMPGITSLAFDSTASPRPEDLTERQEVVNILAQAVGEALTERQRTALTAYVLDGVPIEEIARRMGSNRNAMYKLVHDARLKLKNYMEARGLSLEYILNLFADT